MLHEFLAANDKELVKRCRAKVALRPAPQPSPTELEYGIPLFLGQLISTLRSEQTSKPHVDAKLPANIGSTAGKHGDELLREGFTVDQVVHDYGDLCQAVTELANEKKAPITVDEFHTFNRCLDNAIADAVTEFGRMRDQSISEAGAQTMNERLGYLAHEFRNLLNAATLAFEAVQRGNVGLNGATGAVLGRSLSGMRELVDRSLADVRLTDGLKVRREPISIRELLFDAQISAAMEAKAKGLAFAAPVADKGLADDADRQLLSSAIANLLQNAFKFSRPNGHVALTAHAAAERVVIEVEDECGGLPPGKTEGMFQPFKQQSGDRGGLGLGLSISRRAVEANGGTLRVRNVPGTGCVFTIDLPRPPPAG
jgi:signal transduction histidine kinase